MAEAEVDPDDAKLVTLARSSRARTGSAQGAAVRDDGSGSLTVLPPTWRPDLRAPYDYVEEVGRLVGYENITPVVPLAPPGRGLTRSGPGCGSQDTGTSSRPARSGNARVRGSPAGSGRSVIRSRSWSRSSP